MHKPSILLILLLLSNYCGAQWMTMDHTPNTRSESMCEYNGELYIGGPFQYQMHMPGPTGTNMVGIARWDSSTLSWDTLGTGTEPGAAIMDMAVYNGNLVLGGGFDSINGVCYNNIAIWDGNSFDSLGPGFGGVQPRVDAVVVYNNELYAGGKFMTSGGVNVEHIAKWTGTSWVNVGDLSGLQIRDLTVYDGYLYACGLRSYGTGVIPINFIARYDGNTWDTTFGGLNAFIANSMIVYNNELYVGGQFGEVYGQAGTLSVNNIARWNGSTWDSVGHGASSINDMTIYNNNLIVGGDLLMIDPMPNPVSKWDGTDWSALGIGNEIDNGYITSIYPYNNDLFISGIFNYVMGTYCLYTARFHDTSIHTTLVDNMQNTAKATVYPNPFSKDVVFDISHIDRSENATLVINDIIGRNVLKQEFKQKIVVNDLKQNGYYIWSIRRNGKVLTSGTILKEE